MTEQRNRLKCRILFRVPERRNNGTSSFRVFGLLKSGTTIYAEHNFKE